MATTNLPLAPVTDTLLSQHSGNSDERGESELDGRRIVAPAFSTITSMGDSQQYANRQDGRACRRTGRYALEHLSPTNYHALVWHPLQARCRRAMAIGEPLGPLNESALGVKRLVFDIDDGPSGRYSLAHVKQIAFSLGQVLRLHFDNVLDPSVYIAQRYSGAPRYHIHAPGVLLVDNRHVHAIWRLLAGELRQQLRLDAAPTYSGHIRVHGAPRESEPTPFSVYHFVYAFDARGSPIESCDKVDDGVWSIRPTSRT